LQAAGYAGNIVIFYIAAEQVKVVIEMQLGSSVVKRDPGYIFVIAVKFILLGNQCSYIW
jgi:hypothetical protein